MKRLLAVLLLVCLLGCNQNEQSRENQMVPNRQWEIVAIKRTLSDVESSFKRKTWELESEIAQLKLVVSLMESDIRQLELRLGD